MRNVEKAREVRLWIRDIIVPGTIAGCILYSNPNVRAFIREKKENIKNKIHKKPKLTVIYGEKVE